LSAHTFASSVDEHSCVHSLDSNEIFGAMLVFVLVSEDNLGERCTSAGIVNNVPDYSLDVTKKRVSNRLDFSASPALGNCRRARLVGPVLTQLSQRSQEFWSGRGQLSC